MNGPTRCVLPEVVQVQFALTNSLANHHLGSAAMRDVLLDIGRSTGRWKDDLLQKIENFVKNLF